MSSSKKYIRIIMNDSRKKKSEPLKPMNGLDSVPCFASSLTIMQLNSNTI